MKLLARLVIAFSLLATTTFAAATTAAPAYANCSGCWFTYPGITCGPDSDAYLSVVSNGPGYIDWQAAYGATSFTGGRFNAGGSWSYVFPSRSLNSYDLFPHNGATIVAHGPGCT
jgi:hypothetical protein